MFEKVFKFWNYNSLMLFKLDRLIKSDIVAIPLSCIPQGIIPL